MKKLNENLILFESKTNVLLYINKNNAYLIDSGNDINLCDEILDYLDKNNLTLKYIINTHSHSDHIKCNNYLKNKTNCLITSSDKERVLIENSDINLNIISNGNISLIKENDYLNFKETKTKKLPNIDNISYIKLDGHSYDMLGILIEDKYFFIADSLFSLKELNYFPFIYDVSKFLKTLDKILNYKDKIIISSHSGIIDAIQELCYQNKKYVIKTIGIIRSLIKDKIDLEELFLKFLNYRNLKTNKTTYFLYKNTFKSFINYMIEEKIINYEIIGNKFYLLILI